MLNKNKDIIKDLFVLEFRDIKEMVTIHIGHIQIMAEKIDKNLLSIKIIEASKSIRNKAVVWLSQMARGIKEILKYSHEKIRVWKK